MRVLHVLSGLDSRQGGVTAATLQLVRTQLDAGIRVSVVSMYAADFNPSAIEQLKAMNVEVTLIGPHARFLARHPLIEPQLTRLIASTDVVHIHALWEEIQHQSARIARSMNKPYVITPHGMLDMWSLSQGRLKKRLYLAWRLRRDLNHAAAIHFTHETERVQAQALVLRSPTIVESLAIDLSDFQPPPARGSFRAAHAAALGDRKILLFMSRIHPKKGLDLLVPAFASIAALTDAVLVIAGPDLDGYRATVEQLARTHGVFDRLLFTGMLDGAERAAAMVDADVFVLPSYQENFGVVVVEALAVGVPVIVSDQVAIHPQITQSGAGEVVPTDVGALSNALARWVGDAALRERASQNARKLVADQFDPRDHAKRWRGHYSALKGVAAS